MSENEKIDLILNGIIDMKVSLGKMEVHQEQQRKEIDDHQKDIENLKTNQNKAMGAVVIINLILVAVGSWISKHI